MAFAHPLDPLSPDEIKVAASVVRSTVSQKRLKNLRFNTITLKVNLHLSPCLNIVGLLPLDDEADGQATSLICVAKISVTKGLQRSKWHCRSHQRQNLYSMSSTAMRHRLGRLSPSSSAGHKCLWLRSWLSWAVSGHTSHPGRRSAQLSSKDFMLTDI